MPKTDTIQVTPELLALLTEIDEFKGAWRALGSIAPDRLRALRRVATIESIGSSTRIEGSSLSDREVERLLANLEIQKFESRDEQEVAGYAEVMETVFAAWQHIPINENHIKQLHRDLLRHSSKDDRHRGEYKKLSNSVAAFDEHGKQIGIVFETATPFDTPHLMAELVAWLTETRDQHRLHPLLIAAVFIVVFLEIHPFQDGNGRLSRILTTLLLLQAGYAYVPYSSLESVIENNKEAYYLALRQTQGTIRTDSPNWQPWLAFFMRALQQQTRRLAVKVEREKFVLADLPELAVKILDYTRDQGRVTMRDMVRATGASSNTLKEHFRNLVKKKLLERHGAGRATWYTLP
ncbi:MAG TPA: Fic family protein [Candidatus Obscuribacter sp.]|nr:Fic family protein [Candidatus Obscuribacter sp.]MBK9277846.1 Fic family protein [Candidatus Obscuribacter sp.]HMW89359.1 Fic family protein [Candidatus Obscuribacter sp.]HMY53412.1 Fic family protein [Candidatus Obscuribacter sp.]HNB15095.1 Fic family protein [Candidatus Obscuribacter sp.]